MKFKRVRANIRKRPVVHVESLESRVLYSADVFSSLVVNLPTAADDLSDVPDWPPHGGQQSVLSIAEPSQVEFKRSDSVVDLATSELRSSSESDVPDSESSEVSGGVDFSGENFIDAESECCTKELVFIDSRTPDFQAMVDDLRANRPDTEFELIIIDSGEDGIDKISSTLATVDQVNAIHIISHGSGGVVQLGSVVLNDDVINQRGDELLQWSDELTDDADILIYGCNLAATEAGVALIDSIALLTAADVAASDDVTGHESLGGNWELEYVNGHVTTDIAFSPDLQANWVGGLDTIFVTNFNDVVNGNVSNVANLIANDGGDGISLREAVIASNNPFNVADVIQLESGTYTLSITGNDNNSGDLNINGPLHIIGAANGNTVIDANDIDRVFEINNGTTTFENLTIQGGDVSGDGGALLIGGSAGAILESVVVRDNEASGFGGGIRVSGSLTVNNSVIENNTASRGGGVLLAGGNGNSINATTISGNTSSTSGGGVVATSGSHTFTNTTISGNTSATGGGFQSDGASTQIVNSTITKNEATVEGGGLKRNSGTVMLDGSIVAGNIAPSEIEVFGNISSAGNNIIGDDPGDSTGGTGYSATDLQDEIDLELGLLQDNGGSGQTHALLSGSAGIDPGNTSATDGIDGRGFTRDADHDTGAFEFGATPPTPPVNFLLSTEEDVSASGTNGLTSWTDADVLQVTDLSIEPGVSEGTFGFVADLNTFSMDGAAEIDAIHIVSAPITVGGGAASFSLQPGDLLLSVVDDETFTSNNTLAVSGDDVFVFQPTTFSDYSSGTFTKLLQGGGAGGSPILDRINGITLVESPVTVGGISLQPGDFLFSRDNGFGANTGDIFQFTPSGVGDSTTDGTVDLFLDANRVSIFTQVDAIDIAETALQINGTTIDQGSLLLSLDTFDISTGDNTIATNRQDIFSLELTAAGINTAGDASLVLEGLDVGLDSDAEDVNAFSIHGDIPSVTANIPPEANPNSSSGSEDQLLPITIAGTDSDGTVDSFEIISLPLNGTLYSDALRTNAVAANDVLPASASGTLDLWFDPDLNWNGATDFDFSVFDDQGLESASPATSTITITAVNDAPVINENVPTLFINEIHYDDVSIDTGEAVEIAGTAGTDLTGWTLYLYNGSTGLRYDTLSLSGIIPDQDSGFGTLSFGLPVNGLENGPADGVALVDNTGSLIEFLSYEGVVTALDGPLAGLTSQDIGVEETNSTVEGTSIQLTDSGWVAGLAETFDQPNTSQDLSLIEPGFPIQTVNEDTDLVFSALNGNELSVSDVDAGTDDVEVTLSVASGTLNITNLAATISGLTGNGTNAVSFLADTVSATSALDNLTYRGAQDFNGADTLQIVVDDQGNNGGTALTATQDIDIFVLPVNDVPAIDLDENDSSGETGSDYLANYPAGIGLLPIVDVDAVLDDINSPVLNSITVEITNPLDGIQESITADAGITSITVDDTTAGTLVLNGPATIADFETVLKTVQYQNLSTTPDLTTRNITFTVNDGVDDSALATALVKIFPDTTSPIVSANTGMSLNEGFTEVISSSRLSYIDVQPAASVSYTVTVAPVNGHLAFGTAPGTAITGFTQADINASSLVYVHSGSETQSDEFTFTVGDSLGNVTGAQVFSITVNSVNEAPEGTDTLLTLVEDTQHVFTDANFGFTDPNEGHGFQSIVIASVPVNGTLEFFSGQVVVGQQIFVSDFSELVYQPFADVNGSASDTFSFRVMDDGGVSNGGVSLDPTPNTITFNVTPANDAPVLSTIETGSAFFPENGTVGITGNLSVADVDDTDIESATISIVNNYVASEDELTFTPQFGIGGTFTSGVLSLTGTATLAQYEEVIHSVSYTNSSDDPSTATRKVEITVNDGDLNSNLLSRDVEVIPVNDAPVAMGVESTALSYVENSGAVVVSNTLSLSDIDDVNLEGATVQVGMYINGEDILSFSDTPTINHVWNPSSGVLTLSGTDTVANYQAALRSVAYENTRDMPTVGTLTVLFTVSDGDVNSNVESRTITISAVNDAPVLATIEAMPASHIENGLATGITGNLSISDVDDTQIESATVTISSNYVPGEDILTFNPQPGITGTFSNGTLTFTGPASQTDYETVIHSVTYSNTSENPSAATRTVEITINDGDIDSNTLSRDVEIVPVNDAPVESGIESTALFYQENSGPAVVSNTLVLSDIDDVNLEGAAVQVGGYIDSEDTLSFADTATITHAWDPVNGVLTLTGTDTVANYQAALRSVAYENSSANPVTNPRTVSFTVSDGDLDSNVESRVINIVAVNNAPVLATIETQPASHIENSVATGITGNLSISDFDDSQIESATVTIINNYVAGEDSLSFTSQFGIAGSFANGTLSLTGTAALAEYEAVIHSVAYSNNSENPSGATRTVEIVVNDGDSDSNPLTRDVEVTPVNDAPVESGIESTPLLYIENSGSSVVSNTLTLSDIDDVNLDGASVQIGGYINGEDSLLFVDTATITHLWDPSSGVLTLSGTDTVANYQTALRSVAFENSSANPVTSPRTVSFTVSDGDLDSNVESRVINIGAVNNAPVLATIETQPASYVENAAATGITGNLSISDVDDSQIESATVTISNNYVAGEDILSFAPQAGISGTFSNGSLTLSGSATLAEYEAVIRSVAFETISENPVTATRTVGITVNDGDADSNILSRDVEVSQVNDAPTLATIEIQPAIYLENAVATNITGNLSISDFDDSQIESATVTISNNYVAGEDNLSFTSQFGIAGSFANGTLSLTGTATLAEYEAVIHSVAYSNNSENPSGATRTVEIVVNDGDSDSNPLTRDVEVTPVNDAPVESGIESTPLLYIENSGSSVVSNTLTLSDIDDVNLDGASVQIGGYINGEDSLLFVDTATITHLWDPSSGVLTLSGTDTVANYQVALRSVAYENSSANPVTSPRTVSFSVSDGDSDSNIESRVININAVNNAPVLATIETQPASYIENSAATGITGNLSISDVDDSQIESATVTISNNYVSGEDNLSFTPQAGISGTFSNGTLTLSGSATLAEYEAVIHSVAFETISENPVTATRTVGITVNDGNADSNILSRDIEVFRVNDAPTLATIELQPAIYQENTATTNITGSLSISDVDNSQIESATVTIINNYAAAEDQLTFISQSGISGTFSNGTLTLTGSASHTEYESVIHSVAYLNSSDNPSVATRSIQIIVSDGDADSNALTRNIEVIPVNDAPALATIETQAVAYTENAASAGITGNLSITDIDDSQIEAATITISNNYIAGEDLLTFTSQFGITGSFSNGTLSLTGTATLAEYEAVIHSVAYSNSSDDPSAATRTVEISVNDGDVDSNPVTRDVEVIPVNDAPVASGVESTALFYVEGSGVVAVSNSLNISDADDTGLVGATVQINNYVSSEDSLSFTDTANITGVWDPSAGVLTLAGTDTVANYQAALRSVAYENSSFNPLSGPRSVAFTVFDGEENSNVETRVISIDAVNDAPILSAIETVPASYVENSSGTGITGNLSISDTDDIQIESAAITLSNNFVASEDMLSFTPQSGITSTFSNGTIILTGSATVAEYEAAIHSVVYSNTSENPSLATRTVEITVNDGEADSNLVSRDIEIIRVNDAPVLSGIEVLPANYTENSADTGITGNLSINDVDDTQIESATITITGNFITAEDSLSFTSQFGIVGDFSGGSLTLTGSATLAEYETVIRSVVYSNASENPSALTRSVEITVNDGNTESNPVSREVQVVPVNDAPVESGIESTVLSYQENIGAAVITNTLELSDLDDVSLAGATVQVGGYVNGEDVLSFANTANIAGVWNPSTGTLTLAGNDSVEAYQAALRSVTYENASDNPASTPRAVAFIVSDGDINSNVQSRIIEVGSVNDTPTLATIEALPAVYTENSAPVLITGNLSISDVDDLFIASATLTISNNHVAAEDALLFTDQSGIVGTYQNGTLALTGVAKITDYETAIRSVTYTNASENPTVASRTIEITINDGDVDSNTLSREIDIIAVNDVPVITTVETDPLIYIENASPVVVSNTLNLADTDSVNLNGATIQISGNYSLAEDTLLFTDTSAITHSWDSLTGTLILTGTDTVANYQAALRSVAYLNTSDDPDTSVRTIDIAVTDSEQGSSDVIQRELQIVTVNDEPSGADGIITTLEDASYTFTVNDFGFNDNRDNNQLDSVLITSVPSQGLLVLGNASLMAGDYVSRAEIDSGLFTYLPQSNANGAGVATFEFQVQDNGGTLNSGADTDATANTITFDIVSVNDAPEGGDNLITISEDTAYIFSQSDFPFTDTDGDQLAGITIGSLPEIGSLVLSNAVVGAGDFISLSEIVAGEFVLIPIPGELNNIVGGFDYQVRDSGGTMYGGADTDISGSRIDFNLSGVNDPPQIITSAASVDEGDRLVISEAFLTGFDPDDTDPNELTFTVQNLPDNGELILAGIELTEGDNFSLADVVAGSLSYEHNGSETDADLIEFSLADGGEDGASPSTGQLPLFIREVIDAAPAAADEQLVIAFGDSFDSTSGDVLASGNAVLSGDVLLANPEFTVEIVEEPENGSLNLLPDGNFIYEHNGSANLEDQFTYRIINQDGIFTEATVNITVNAPLQVGLALEQELAATESIVTPVPANTESAEESGEVGVETIEEESEGTEASGGASLTEFEFLEPPDTATEVSLLQELGVSTASFDNSSDQGNGSQSLLEVLEVIKHNSIRASDFNFEGSDLELQRIDVTFQLENNRVGISNTNFLRALKQVDSDLQEADTEQTLKIQLSNDAIFGVSISATAGIVAWALRGGALLASVMAATPIWASIDPVRVLNTRKDDDESDTSEVEQIFE